MYIEYVLWTLILSTSIDTHAREEKLEKKIESQWIQQNMSEKFCCACQAIEKVCCNRTKKHEKKVFNNALFLMLSDTFHLSQQREGKNKKETIFSFENNAKRICLE